MSKLGELIQELCPDGVRFIPISKCVEKIKNIKWAGKEGQNYQYIDLTSVDRDTHQITDTQTISAENAPSRAKQIVQTGDILLGATRPMLKRYCFIGDEYDGQICSTGFCVLRANNNIVLQKWLYHQIASSEFFTHVEKYQRGASYPAISDADVKSFRISVPPLPVQHEIVRMIDNFVELTLKLTVELTAELSARRKQSEYYRNNLLNFGDDVPIVKLGKIADFKYGFTDTAKEHGTARFIRITDISDSGKLLFSNCKYIDLNTESEKYLLEKGDLLMARTGATYGKTMLFNDDIPAVYASFLIRIRFTENTVLPAYYWHFAQSSLYWNQANKLVSKAGQPQFNANVLKTIVIPVPSIDEQQRIINLLDHFDILSNETNRGLLTEIEARRKQYEYYRDKLLTFQEVGV